MNKENREMVERIKSIVDTLSDLSAISEIENYMYNSRYRIAKRAELGANQ